MSVVRSVTLAAIVLVATASVVGSASSDGRDLEFRSLVSMPINAERVRVLGALAALVHGERVYVATQDGLFRLLGEGPSAVLEPLNPVTGIRALAVTQDALYVARTPDSTSEHSVLRSGDGGTTFVPADAGLEYCFAALEGSEQCLFLQATDLEVDSGMLLGNFGALNVFAWNAEQGRWELFLGTAELGGCYSQSFELVRRRVFVGGECPLDVAYLRSARRPRDGTPIPFERLREVKHPRVSNRNIQFIAQRRDTSVVFAGVEGGLLRSTDGGTSFRFRLRFTGAPYPYISEILFPTAEKKVVVVGGGSQRDEPFVAYSGDGGVSWKNLSDALPEEIPRTGASVDFLVERNPVSFLVGITRGDEATGFAKDMVLVEARRPPP